MKNNYKLIQTGNSFPGNRVVNVYNHDCPISKKYCIWAIGEFKENFPKYEFCPHFERELVPGSSKVKATYCKYTRNSVRFIKDDN